MMVIKGIDLETMRQQLEAKRTQLLEGVSRARERSSIEGESGAPDLADRATSSVLRENSFSLTENDRKLLRLIEEALARMGNNQFGICVACQDLIEEPRLKAIPWARHCIACQEQQDRGEL